MGPPCFPVGHTGAAHGLRRRGRGQKAMESPVKEGRDGGERRDKKTRSCMIDGNGRAVSGFRETTGCGGGRDKKTFVLEKKTQRKLLPLKP
ncbi:hypothetical protein BHM03_00008182 [Ensete ventricosum]|nr:hypothetical protein BHM03_00008182 [Ensete ventricosum]